MSKFKIINSTVSFSTNGEIEFIDLTNQICDAVANSSVKNGLVHVFSPHSTGVLLLTENDPALIQDIQRFFEKIVPKSLSYQHPSNAYAHLRSVLFPPDRTIPVVEGKAIFGIWQSLFFVETDVQPRRRKIVIQIMGEI